MTAMQAAAWIFLAQYALTGGLLVFGAWRLAPAFVAMIRAGWRSDGR